MKNVLGSVGASMPGVVVEAKVKKGRYRQERRPVVELERHENRNNRGSTMLSGCLARGSDTRRRNRGRRIVGWNCWVLKIDLHYYILQTRGCISWSFSMNTPDAIRMGMEIVYHELFFYGVAKFFDQSCDHSRLKLLLQSITTISVETALTKETRTRDTWNCQLSTNVVRWHNCEYEISKVLVCPIVHVGSFSLLEFVWQNSFFHTSTLQSFIK
jgi:hypothetical protein